MNAIRVYSEIEDVRPLTHHRKGSMPLVIVDKTNKKFKIYDKEFEAEREKKEITLGEKKKS